MGYLKRTQAPKFWPIERKGRVWTMKPRAGPHPLDMSIPLSILIRDILKLADTSKETKSVIKQGKVLVDKKPRTDPNFALGLMDSVEIPESKIYLRISIGRKGLEAASIDKSETGNKICRIRNKKTLKKGLFQLNLHDGRNILTEDNAYKTGDSLLLSLPEQKIMQHMQLAEGADVKITGGKNMGIGGKIKKIVERKSALEKSRIIVDAGDRQIETLKDCVLVTGIGAKHPGKPDDSGEPHEAKGGSKL